MGSGGEGQVRHSLRLLSNPSRAARGNRTLALRRGQQPVGSHCSTWKGLRARLPLVRAGGFQGRGAPRTSQSSQALFSLGSTATAVMEGKAQVLRVRRATDQGHRRHPWAAASGHWAES